MHTILYISINIFCFKVSHAMHLRQIEQVLTNEISNGNADFGIQKKYLDLFLNDFVITQRMSLPNMFNTRILECPYQCFMFFVIAKFK